MRRRAARLAVAATSVALIALLAPAPELLADETPPPGEGTPEETRSDEGEKESKYRPTFIAGLGFSYPLVASLSGGMMLPLGKSTRYGLPNVPAIEIDLDVGLGGGVGSLGLAFPASRHGADGAMFSVRAAALRPWLLDVGQKRDRTYFGSMVDLIVESHPGGRLGLGYFKEHEPSGSRRDQSFMVYFKVVGV